MHDIVQIPCLLTVSPYEKTTRVSVLDIIILIKQNSHREELLETEENLRIHHFHTKPDSSAHVFNTKCARLMRHKVNRTYNVLIAMHISPSLWIAFIRYWWWSFTQQFIICCQNHIKIHSLAIEHVNMQQI